MTGEILSDSEDDKVAKQETGIDTTAEVTSEQNETDKSDEDIAREQMIQEQYDKIDSKLAETTPVETELNFENVEKEISDIFEESQDNHKSESKVGEIISNISEAIKKKRDIAVERKEKRRSDRANLKIEKSISSTEQNETIKPDVIDKEQIIQEQDDILDAQKLEREFPTIIERTYGYDSKEVYDKNGRLIRVSAVSYEDYDSEKKEAVIKSEAITDKDIKEFVIIEASDAYREALKAGELKEAALAKYHEIADEIIENSDFTELYDLGVEDYDHQYDSHPTIKLKGKNNNEGGNEHSIDVIDSYNIGFRGNAESREIVNNFEYSQEYYDRNQKKLAEWHEKNDIKVSPKELAKMEKERIRKEKEDEDLEQRYGDSKYYKYGSGNSSSSSYHSPDTDSSFDEAARASLINNSVMMNLMNI